LAARWQQWMPFHIDRFKGSPAVQAMHPAARMGYLYLLSCQWQSDECSLPSDPIDLAEMSGLGDELWLQYSMRILRKFDVLPNGRLRNDALFEEWEKAQHICDPEKRRAAAVTKWGDAEGDKRGRDLRSQRLAIARTKGTHTDAQWESLKAFCRHQCVRCGDNSGKLFRDHIKPIYQGGSDGIDNIQPLCPKCNSSKGREAIDFRPEGWVEACGEGVKCLQMPANASHSNRNSNRNRSTKSYAKGCAFVVCPAHVGV
jgi:5-methylcytosine-specific restriction endonuclease McrA